MKQLIWISSDAHSCRAKIPSDTIASGFLISGPEGALKSMVLDLLFPLKGDTPQYWKYIAVWGLILYCRPTVLFLCDISWPQFCSFVKFGYVLVIWPSNADNSYSVAAELLAWSLFSVWTASESELLSINIFFLHLICGLFILMSFCLRKMNI